MLQEKQPRPNEVSGNITGQGGGKGGEIAAAAVRVDHGVGMTLITELLYIYMVIADRHVL